VTQCQLLLADRSADESADKMLEFPIPIFSGEDGGEGHGNTNKTANMNYH